jgi:hypothetical protein
MFDNIYFLFSAALKDIFVFVAVFIKDVILYVLYVLFDIRVFYMTSDNAHLLLLKEAVVDNSSRVTDTKTGYGLFAMKRCIGNITATEATIIATTYNYHQLIKNITEVDSFGKNTYNVTTYNKYVDYIRPTIYLRNALFERMEAHENQADVLGKIIGTYDKRGSASAIISGEPGCGKSTVASLLAQHFNDVLKKNVAISFTFNTPFEYLNSKPPCVKRSEVLVLVFDEIDICITNMHSASLNNTENKSTNVYTKRDWNLFFDDYSRGMYPNTILLMTTNKSLETLDDLDPSYLRAGRVDFRFKMCLPKSTSE